MRNNLECPNNEPAVGGADLGNLCALAPRNRSTRTVGVYSVKSDSPRMYVFS
jgi:hypothetical protein